MNYHKIVTDIEKLIHGDISVDLNDLRKHSTDASLFTVMPQIIIYPKDKFDIQAIVKYIRNLKYTKFENKYDKDFVMKLSLTARAAGTCMSGGSLNDSIILDVTKYMKNFGKVEVGGATSGRAPVISCEPGTYFRDLEKYLNTKDLMYPSYPASKDLCCVGGIVANNSSGEKTLLYGSTKDWVEEIEMIMDDGTIHNFKKISFSQLESWNKILRSEGVVDGQEYSGNSDERPPGDSKFSGGLVGMYSNLFNLIKENKDLIQKNKPIVTKNSSGYDLWDIIDWKNETIDMCKLIVGSQGTLGIITNVKLRLTQKKKYSQMVTVLMPDLNDLVKLVEEILKYKPEAIETFDDHTFKIAMKFLPSIIWKLKGNIWQLATSFIPEAWMAVTGGIPKLILMAEFTGVSQEEATQKTELAFQHIQNFKYKSRVTKSEIDVQKYWLFRRESFNLLRSKLRGFRTAPFVEDIIIPLQNMQEFIPQMQTILDKYNYTYTIAGHAGNGNFHIIPLMKLNTQTEIETIKKTNQEVFSLVQKYHGSISAEHNDGLVRTPYLHFMFDDATLNLFVQVKQLFDPLYIFNPNKKVGGSIKENYSKIKLEK
jgi:FAD/FMN-containing dehydrogenase